MKSGPIGVGVVGLGFMGQTHVKAYQRLAGENAKCRLVAVADQDPDRRAGKVVQAGNIDAGGTDELFDPREVRGYEDAASLLNDDEVDLVSICTPTDTHVDIAIRALNAGKHVLVEKPVAIRLADVERLAQAARDADTLCMPAMCIRFWPAWRWIKDRIDDGEFGKLISMSLTRLGSTPDWAPAFYNDPSRCGGALFDLHIHDTDFVYWCLGMPRAVLAAGDRTQMSTTYVFEDGPGPIVAEGGWKQQPAFGYRMRYAINFERATADFELGREAELLMHTEQGSRVIELSSANGWDLEIEHLVERIRSGGDLDATMDDAVAVTRILEGEAHSLEQGNVVRALR